MKEKLLKKLKESREKNSQVSDRTLEMYANTLSTYITTDEMLTAFDPKPVIKEIEGNINHVVSSVKKPEPPKTPATPPEPPKPNEGAEIPEYVKQLLAQNKALTETVTGLTTQVGGLANETKNTKRKAALKKVYEGIPKDIAKNAFTEFDLISENMSDEAFDSYIETKKATNEQLSNTFKAKGMDFVTPENAQIEKDSGQTEVLEKARKIQEAAKNKAKETK